MSSDKEEGFIPSKIYNRIVELMPIVSVEAVIVKDNALLFLKRNNEPALGQWWFPGGRIRKGEPLEEALSREIKEETGLAISDFKLINVYSRVFPQRHDITIVYLCKYKEGEIMLNDEHSECAFFNCVPNGLHPFLLEVIRDCKLDNFLS